MKGGTYRWKGRVEDNHTVRVHEVIEVQPGTEVELVAFPALAEPSEEEHAARLKAWKEFRAMPISEEDKRFWEELERQTSESRRGARWREAGL